MYQFLDNYALYSYELLQLKQPHLKTEGIYKKGLHYFIKCDSFEVQPLDSNYDSITLTFDKEIRILGCPVELVTQLPEGAIKMKNRNPIEIINLSGNPLNIIDFNKQLSILLPKNIPGVWVEFNHSTKGWDAYLERELSNDDIKFIKDKINLICGYKANIAFIVRPSLRNDFNQSNHTGLSISVSRHSAINFSQAVMSKWAEDEQIWSDNKERMFTINDAENCKQTHEQSSCLINGTFGKAHNIRNYLTLFNEINIVVPVGSTYEELLNSLSIKKQELLKLLEIDKIKLIFPNSLDRYNKDFIENAVAINPNNVIFSMELAYKTVEDLKYRNPFTFF